MTKEAVRKSGTTPEQLNYSNLPNDIKDVIAEPLSDKTEKEANINYDGKQWLVRFPNDIANAIGIKKGDKIKFKVVLPSPETRQPEDIEIKFIRSEKSD